MTTYAVTCRRTALDEQVHTLRGLLALLDDRHPALDACPATLPTPDEARRLADAADLAQRETRVDVRPGVGRRPTVAESIALAVCSAIDTAVAGVRMHADGLERALRVAEHDARPLVSA